jgi:hypothetical protein
MPFDDESYNKKDSFHKELEHVFDHFPTYHMEILIRGSLKR